MKNFLSKHRKVISVALIGIPIIIFAAAGVGLKFAYNKTGTEMLEAVAYLSQIISAVFVIAGVIIAGWQYYITSTSELEQIKIDQVQRAIDFAEYYKDNILHKYTPVEFVYEQSGIIDILKSIDKDKIKYFDMVEAKKCLTEAQIESLKKIQNSKEFTNSVVTAQIIYGTASNNIMHGVKNDALSELDISKISDILEKADKNDIEKISEKVLLLNDGLATLSFMRDEINVLLNNMEYFAMNFMHGTADETVVYPSLHQTYIRIVQTLYFDVVS